MQLRQGRTKTLHNMKASPSLWLLQSLM